MKKNKASKWLGIAVIVFFLMFVFGMLDFLDIGPFSVLDDVLIGEEGFEPYDPALKAGSYTPSLWGVDTQTFNFPGGYYDSARTLTLAESTRLSTSTNQMNFLYTASGEDWYSSASCYRHGVGNLQVICLVPSYKTTNLYLKDFRMEVQSTGGTSLDARSKICAVESSSISIVADGSAVGSFNFGITSPAYSPCPSSKIAFELRWDDYETGHFQVFKSNQLVAEGTAKNELYLSWTTREERTPHLSRTFNIYNPRVKDLFGCDNEEGMLIVDACYGGPDVLEREELTGWVEGQSKLCIELPAQRINDGLTSSSKRVLYDLASGDPVVIEANEAWKFSYMTPDESVGEKIGFGYGCVEKVLVDDTKDLEQQSEMISNRVGYWLVDKSDTNFRSGSERLYVASFPEYTCQSSDGHNPTGDLISYPNPRADCWKIDFDGKTMIVGDTKNTEWFDFKLSQFRGVYNYDDEDGDEFRDNWQALFLVTLVKNPIIINSIVVDGDELELDIDVGLKGDYTLLARHQPQNINQKTTDTASFSLSTGNQKVRVGRLVSEGVVVSGLGFVMSTEIGSFQASDEALFSYEEQEKIIIDEKEIDLGDEKPSGDSIVINEVISKPWYIRFWEWIIGLFKY